LFDFWVMQGNHKLNIGKYRGKMAVDLAKWVGRYKIRRDRISHGGRCGCRDFDGTRFGELCGFFQRQWTGQGKLAKSRLAECRTGDLGDFLLEIEIN
jgi:hypothetical protein